MSIWSLLVVQQVLFENSTQVPNKNLTLILVLEVLCNFSYCPMKISFTNSNAINYLSLALMLWSL